MGGSRVVGGYSNEVTIDRHIGRRVDDSHTRHSGVHGHNHLPRTIGRVGASAGYGARSASSIKPRGHVHANHRIPGDTIVRHLHGYREVVGHAHRVGAIRRYRDPRAYPVLIGRITVFFGPIGYQVEGKCLHRYVGRSPDRAVAGYQ